MALRYRTSLAMEYNKTNTANKDIWGKLFQRYLVSALKQTWLLESPDDYLQTHFIGQVSVFQTRICRPDIFIGNVFGPFRVLCCESKLAGTATFLERLWVTAVGRCLAREGQTLNSEHTSRSLYHFINRTIFRAFTEHNNWRNKRPRDLTLPYVF